MLVLIECVYNTHILICILVKAVNSLINLIRTGIKKTENLQESTTYIISPFKRIRNIFNTINVPHVQF